LETATYVTIFSPAAGGFICGKINLGWETEVKQLALMNNKGNSFLFIEQFPFIASVTSFNGMASDNTQCNSSISYTWLVDTSKLVRRIFADVPIEIPSGTSAPPQVIIVKQYYQYDTFTVGTPNPSLFTLPPICQAPYVFDWCATFFPAPICLFPPSAFS